ncbi:ImuA family protein [Siccirubricoccus phaeus]|uniref:ImuA family protein n=1 Tax=Siccirubricoccus phaeus TaxID=2595053 RepID=UPI0038B570AA
MALLEDLRERVARIERRPLPPGRLAVVPFGVPGIDAALPGGGIARGALHEAAGSGPDTEHGATAALLAASVLARAAGPVLWVSTHFDLFAPALAEVGLGPERVLHVEAGREVLAAVEEGLRHPGLAGVVGEVPGRLGLTASRRLQLAAEATGAIAFALRRSPRHDDPGLAEPSAAVTRWRVASLPSAPPLPWSPDTPGLGRARWRLELLRARGGEPCSWIVECPDAQGRLALAADLADRPAAQGPRAGRRRAAG